MQLSILLLALTSLSCAGVPRDSRSGVAAPVASQDALPAASGPLSVPQLESGGLTLADLLRELARLTDQHLVMTEQTRQAIQQTPVVIGGQSEIPAAEVYAFVEGLLYFHGYYTAQLKGGEHPVLGVYWIRDNQVSSVNTAPRMAVPADELAEYAAHPAFLIQTVIELPYVDVRQLSTSLRGMLKDTNTQTLLAVGEHGVVLAGTGQWVVEMATLMQATDEQERAAWERRAKARKAGEEGGEGGEEGGH